MIIFYLYYWFISYNFLCIIVVVALEFRVYIFNLVTSTPKVILYHFMYSVKILYLYSYTFLLLAYMFLSCILYYML